MEGMNSESYIRFSITNPGGYTVEGFPGDIMPSSLIDELGEEDLKALIAYLLTLN
jgi:hypothetical protein